MEAGAAKTKVEKPETPPAEPKTGVADTPAPYDAEKAVAELTAKVEGLEAGITAALEAEVAKYLGADGPIAKKVDAALEQVDGILQAKTAELGEDASSELEKLIQWAHARINALHVGVSRAIGVTITLPDSPTQAVTGDVTVTGTETADRLGQ